MMNLGESKQEKGILVDLLNQRIQLELLFSTGAVVTLINLPNWVRKEFTILGEKCDILFLAFFQLSQIFVLAGINALIIGFMLNIFFRVLTLCFLGIDYVFPEGIIAEKLNYAEYAKQKILKNTDTKQLIERTEKLAGFSFSFSIMLVIKLLGLGIVFFLIIMTIESLGIDLFSLEYSKNNEENIDTYFFLASVIALGILDYIFFVLLRKFEIIAKIYYPFYLFFNFISLNFLTRKQSLILYSNFGRLKTNILIVLFLILGITLSNKNNMKLLDKRDFSSNSSNLKFSYSSRLYDDERSEDVSIGFISIPSKYISSNYLPVFCTYPAWFDYDLEMFYKPQENISRDSLQQVENEELKRINAIGKYISLELNDSLITHQQWFYCRHPKTKQFGVLTHIPITNLKEGLHRLSYKLNVQDGNKYVGKSSNKAIYINFIKVSK